MKQAVQVAEHFRAEKHQADPLGMADRQATSTVPNTPIAAEFAWSTDTGRQQTVARICWYLTPLRRYPFGY